MSLLLRFLCIICSRLLPWLVDICLPASLPSACCYPPAGQPDRPPSPCRSGRASSPGRVKRPGQIEPKIPRHLRPKVTPSGAGKAPVIQARIPGNPSGTRGWPVIRPPLPGTPSGARNRLTVAPCHNLSGFESSYPVCPPRWGPGQEPGPSSAAPSRPRAAVLERGWRSGRAAILPVQRPVRVLLGDLSAPRAGARRRCAPAGGVRGRVPRGLARAMK